MERWKLNLIVLWIGNFLVMSGMTMIVPFLSLYLKQDLGLTDEHEIGVWAGIIFAGNFMTSFIFQPIWGKVADRYGRKPMLLRSGFGMAVVMTLMGFSSSAWHLLLLRMLNGTISGFVPAATALVSATTPKQHVGFAMGTLQSGAVAGSILGPLMGGLLADWVGFRPIFYITGALLFAASLLAMLTVKDHKFNKEEAAKAPQQSVLQGFRDLTRVPQLTSLFAVTFMIQFAMLSPMPLLPLFVQELHGTTANLAFFAGFVSAVSGLSNMVAAPVLGRISDKHGATRVLLFSMIGAALMIIPQAFVHTVWQLIFVRFLLGLCLGGMMPSVNALIRKYTPDGMESRSYSFNSSTLSLGNMIGPIVGGALSGPFGIQGVFIFSAILLLLNVEWIRRTLFQRQKNRSAA